MGHDHLLRSVGGRRQQARHEGRSVAGQDGVRRRPGVEIAKEVPLDFQVFGNSLDDQVGIGDGRAKIGTHGDARGGGGRFIRA